MIDLFASSLFGVAAHQTDPLVKNWPHRWELLGRYIVGGLTVILSFAIIMARMNRAALRDALLSLCGAFASVGVGVSVGMVIDEVIK